MKELYKTFQEITPDCLESIHEELKQRKDEQFMVEMTKKKRQRYYMIPVVIVSMVICLFILWPTTSKIYATVALDVNPSVELDIDDQHMIQKVKANNDDGQKIIGDMKLKGVDLEVGMNALIGSMLKEGYISELKNSLLISVTGDHQKENEVLRKELSDEIDQLLKNHHIDGSVVSLALEDDENIDALASKYHISTGKAQLIKSLIAKNTQYTFEELKDLSVNELNILLSRYDVDTNKTGEASQKGYIGKDKATQIAYQDAKVSQPTLKEIELDYEKGVMVYEIEFIKDGIEYEYDIDAQSGQILKRDKKEKHHQTTTSSSNISEAQAKELVLNHAHVKNVQNYQLKKDKDDGILEYEIEFVSGKYLYEYKVDASHGKILESEKKYVGEVKLSESEAKQIALNHAKVSSHDTKDMDIELKKNYYEVSFEVRNDEYEYHIDASTGNILSHHKERD